MVTIGLRQLLHLLIQTITHLTGDLLELDQVRLEALDLGPRIPHLLDQVVGDLDAIEMGPAVLLL